MGSTALLRHFAGRMAGPARWYLAVLSMVSLLLLAAHFSVQEHVQKKMRQVVHTWLQENGGSVQHVRYRLLRGALTLEQAHWVDPADPSMVLDVSQVFIQTSSRAISSHHPTFSLLRFERPRFSMRRKTLLAWLRGEPSSALFPLAGMMTHARAVVVSDMRLRIAADEAGDHPRFMLLHQARGRFGPDGMVFVGVLGGGRILLDGQVGEKGHMNGRMALRSVPLDSLAVLSGHASSSSGVMASGDLLLHGDWNKRDVDLDGTMRLHDVMGTGSLLVKGGWSATGARMYVKCGNVPLAGLPLVWPEFAGRRLVAGRLSGEMHLARKWREQGWNIGMDGGLTGVRLASSDRPAWQIGSLRLSGATMHSESGSFAAGQVQLADADIALNAFEASADGKPQNVPEIAALSLQRVRPQVHFADGSELVLPELQGKGRIGKQGSLSLATVRGTSDGAEGVAAETWKIRAQGDSFTSWKAQLSAGHVPVVRLRPLLPDVSLPGEQGVPEYSGYADLKLQLLPGADGLHVAGTAELHDVRMIQGGDQLLASLLDIEIADAGGDGIRRLSRIAVSGWQYQMALRPLPRLTQPAQAAAVAHSVGAEPDSQVAARPAAGAGQASGAKEEGQGQRGAGEDSEVRAVASSNLNWEVDEITAKDGRISLGQPDALIARQLLFTVRHVVRGKLSPFTLSGLFGDGDLRSQGKMQLQPGFLMGSKTTIRHALPFVFNDWMQLSGMPRFVRGRLNVLLHITPDGPVADGLYKGKLNVGLYQGAMEAGSFTEDSMLQRVGYSARGLFERLNVNRQLGLAVPFSGDWAHTSLSDRLGEAGLDALKKAADEAHVTKAQPEPPVVKLTRLRLQGKRGFSHNERVRLRRMVKVLMRDKSLIVELTPQLGTAPLDAETIRRVTYSQHLVTMFMRRLGVASQRIFPVWPQQKHQHGDAPGLLLQARPS